MRIHIYILGGRKDLERVDVSHVQVGDSQIARSTTARNIGAYFDSEMTLSDHISITIRSSYNQIRSIAKIRKYLTSESAKKLVHAFITSRLDNLNSLLINLPNHQISRLQKVQNSAARLITRQKMDCHVTPLLKDLHWLPVESRIKYKILLQVFKCLSMKGPAYLCELLHEYMPDRTLRSSSQLLLEETRVNKMYGSRAFAVVGPQLWNRLPMTIKTCSTISSFKTAIKTHLFAIEFPDC